MLLNLDIIETIKTQRETKDRGYDLKILSNAALCFQNIIEGTDIFQIIGEQLQSLTSDAIIISSLYISDINKFRVHNLLGIQALDQLQEILGVNLNQLEISVGKKFFQTRLEKQKIILIQSGLYGLFMGQISKDQCLQAEKQCGIDKVYAFNLTQQGMVIARIFILMKRGFSIRNLDIIRTFIYLAELAIQNYQNLLDLHKRDQILNSFIQQSSDGIVLMNENGKILTWNPALENLSGYSFEEVKNQPAKEIIAKLLRDYSKIKSTHDLVPGYAVGSSLTAQNNISRDAQESTLIHKNGEIRLVEGSFFPIQANGDLLIGGISRDVTKSKRHQQEMEIIVDINKALRSLTSRTEILPMVLEQIRVLICPKGVAITSYSSVYMEHCIDLAWGIWQGRYGSIIDTPNSITSKVVADAEEFIDNAVDIGSSNYVGDLPITESIKAIACIPLNAEHQVIGTIWVAKDAQFNQEEIRILNIVADIGANALHRALMHEQQQRRLEHITALRTIDQTIETSLDLRSSLRVLLDQVLAQLHVDAAAVFLYNPIMQLLEFTEGRGFRTRAITQSNIRIGQSDAGRAAMDGQTIFRADLSKVGDHYNRPSILLSENFVSYFVVPLIAKGETKGILELYHRNRLNPDIEWMNYFENLSGQAAILIDNWKLHSDLQHSNLELKLAYTNTLEGWVRALDMRDQETEGHTKRVTEMTLRLAGFMNMPNDRLVYIYRGALLHDIGKMAVPDSILRKPGPLGKEELKIMRMHPTYAYELLHPIAYLEPSIEIPYAHHERWDGSGYPRGLKCDDIPLAARVFAVVDVWDALRSDRPYREAWSDIQVTKYIRTHSGEYFDPMVVAAFQELIGA
jgi:PAS domain S-box-containing protein